MPELEFEIEIPFVPNSGKRCVPACTSMILKTLIPERDFSMKQAEDLSGFREGYSTWATQHLLSLDELGVEVGWIQDEDLTTFARDPRSFIMNQVRDREEFEEFINTNDVDHEARRVNDYLDRGLIFKQRPATLDDIKAQLVGGWLVRLEVNGEVLAGHSGYSNHAVMVSGFNKEVIRVENPDSKYGSKPKQLVEWGVFDKAWDEPTMQYYRR